MKYNNKDPFSSALDSKFSFSEGETVAHLVYTKTKTVVDTAYKKSHVFYFRFIFLLFYVSVSCTSFS